MREIRVLAGRRRLQHRIRLSAHSSSRIDHRVAPARLSGIAHLFARASVTNFPWPGHLHLMPPMASRSRYVSCPSDNLDGPHDRRCRAPHTVVNVLLHHLGQEPRPRPEGIQNRSTLRCDLASHRVRQRRPLWNTQSPHGQLCCTAFLAAWIGGGIWISHGTKIVERLIGFAAHTEPRRLQDER